jgi:hypothetical protein
MRRKRNILRNNSAVVRRVICFVFRNKNNARRVVKNFSAARFHSRIPIGIFFYVFHSSVVHFFNKFFIRNNDYAPRLQIHRARRSKCRVYENFNLRIANRLRRKIAACVPRRNRFNYFIHTAHPFIFKTLT